MNGTSESKIIGVSWSDDHSWQGYGDYQTEMTVNTEKPITPPAGLKFYSYKLNATLYSQEGQPAPAPITNQEVFVGIDNNDVYFQGMTTLAPKSYMKGTLNGTTVTFANGQYIGNSIEDGLPLFLHGFSGSKAVDVVYTFDSANETYTQSTPFVLFGGLPSKLYFYVAHTQSQLVGEVTGITLPSIDNRTVVGETYFDITGREVSNPENGLFIKSVKYDDGTQETVKVLK